LCIPIRHVQPDGLFFNRQPAEYEPCSNFLAAALSLFLGTGMMPIPETVCRDSATTDPISASPQRRSQP
jgi:hypothetical protein